MFTVPTTVATQATDGPSDRVSKLNPCESSLSSIAGEFEQQLAVATVHNSDL